MFKLFKNKEESPYKIERRRGRKVLVKKEDFRCYAVHSDNTFVGIVLLTEAQEKILNDMLNPKDVTFKLMVTKPLDEQQIAEDKLVVEKAAEG